MKVWWKTKANIGFSEEFCALYALGGTNPDFSSMGGIISCVGHLNSLAE